MLMPSRLPRNASLRAAMVICGAGELHVAVYVCTIRVRENKFDLLAWDPAETSSIWCCCN